MDGPVLGHICVSDSFTQQIISLSENPIYIKNGESKPAADLKFDVDAVNECTLYGTNEHSGAGTNAVSKANIFINVGTSPLSELVWSPRKGLCLKYTDCSLLEKKSSILWSTDLAIMTVLPSECAEGRFEENNNSDVAADGTSLMPLTPISSPNEEICDGKNLALLSESNVDSISLCKLRNEDRSSGVTAKIWLAEAKAGVVNLDVIDEMISPKEAKGDVAICGNEKEANGGLPDKNSAPGVDGCGATDSPFKQEDLRAGLLPITLQGGVPIDKNGDKYCGTAYANGTSAMPSSEGCTIKNCYFIEEPVSDSIADMNKKSANCSSIPNVDRSSASIEHVLQALQAEKNGERGISTLASMKIVESSPYQRKVWGMSSLDTGQLKEDSHESVESSSSGRLYAPGKRAWTSEQQYFVKNKKMKKQNQSFVNWVSCVENGNQKIKKDEKPLSANPVTSSQLINGGHDSHILSLNHNQVCAGRITGFGKFFEALYNKSSRLLNEDTDEGFNEFEGPKKVFCTNRNSHIANAEVNLEMQKNISLDHHFCSNGLENTKSDVGVSISSYDKNAELSKGNKSSSTSLFKENCYSPDIKISNETGYADPVLLVNSTNTNDGRHESIWISRFRPRVPNPERSNMIMDLRVNNLINSCSFLSPSHGQSNKERSYEPASDEDPGIALSRKLQDSPVGQPDSCGLKQTNGDQKLKAKLNPILHSQKLRSAEDIACVFARRLDALKHITPSKARGDADITAFCFFCGMRGHTLLYCTEIFESELEDLLSNHHLYDGSEDASSLCIRCFRLNHWAVACPHTSSNELICGSHIRLRAWNNSLPKSPIVDPDIGNIHISRNKVESHQLTHSSPIFQAVNSNLGDEFACSSNDEKTLGYILPAKMHMTPDPEGYELNKGCKTTFCNSKKIPPVPRKAFQAIRRLRLSRVDLLRWIKFPVPDVALEGLFLRLRLGKWAEGLGTTGYHVARIIGTDQKRASGISNISIYVDVGGFKCSIDFRYVSNHDFTEEELMAWWCASFSGDGKLPTEEELSIKLIKKEKYGH